MNQIPYSSRAEQVDDSEPQGIVIRDLGSGVVRKSKCCVDIPATWMQPVQKVSAKISPEMLSHDFLHE